MSINLFVAEDGDYDKRFNLYQTDTKTTDSILKMSDRYTGYKEYVMDIVDKYNHNTDTAIDHLNKLKEYIEDHKNIEWFGM